MKNFFILSSDKQLLFHKFIFIFSFIFIMAIFFSSAVAQTKLYVKEKSGSQSNYNLSSVRKLTFSNGNMQVYTYDGTVSTYSLNAIRRLTFNEEQVFCEVSLSLTFDTSKGMIKVVNSTLGANKYYWIFDDGTYSNDAVPVHEYKNDGIYRISLTATDTITGCQAKIEKEILVKVSATEPCRADFETTIDTINKKITVINNSSANIDRYYWEFGDGTLSNQKSPVHTYKANGYYAINLIVFDSSSFCADRKLQLINLTDLQKPCRADFTYTVDVATQKIMFASTSEAPVNTKYMWDFNDGYLSTLINPTHQFDNGGFYDVCLSINNADKNCKSTYCQSLKASDTPDFCQAKFDYTVDTLTGAVDFVDNSKGKHNGWEWDFGDGTKVKTQHGKHIFKPGYFTVILKITDSGTNCISYFVDVINVKKEQKLKAGFGFDNAYTKAKGVYPIEFKGASYGDASEMLWDFGDGETNNSSFSPTHEYTSEGTFAACLTVSNTFTGASDISCQEIIIGTTDIQKHMIENNFSIYPNPAKESLVVSIKSLVNTNINEKIVITNTLGQTVFTNNYKLATNYSINISQFQSGLYFVRYGTTVKKFIKE